MRGVSVPNHLTDEQIAHIAGCLLCKARQLDAIKGNLTPEQLALAGRRMKKALL